jgi:hypothetical protein
MPTLQVTEEQWIETKLWFGIITCCLPMLSLWNGQDSSYHPPSAEDPGGFLAVKGSRIVCCPYCGERVVVVHIEQPPKGYMKIKEVPHGTSK